MRHIENIKGIVDWRLCLGCGACEYICRDKNIQLYDYPSEGIRPRVDQENCRKCRMCLDVCPVMQSSYFPIFPCNNNGFSRNFMKKWGPVIEMWEGHATDPDIRFFGASGGVLTAISLYCLEKRNMNGVLHCTQDSKDPIRNRTQLSRTREELIRAAGSRYSPASLCNGLNLVEKSSSPCVVIGKPCEISAARNAMKHSPDLNRNVGILLSFFCAESPSTDGTVKLLNNHGIEPSEISDIRYRGRGWPGHFEPTLKGGTEPSVKLTYRDTWHFLEKFRPWAAHLWPDLTGELADISCGDAWYITPDGTNPGTSLLIARTELGSEIIEGAEASGYLTLAKAPKWKLEKSQGGLLQKKGAIWGRRLALRLFGVPVTSFHRANLFSCWTQLSFGEKIRSFLGTIHRVFYRKLYRPRSLNPGTCRPVEIPLEPDK